MRYIIGLIFCFLFLSQALAQEESKLLCKGKYEAVKKQVKGFDAISPYNGGNFFSSYNLELMSTIEAYRAMEGLPPLMPEDALESYKYLQNKNKARSTYSRAYSALRLMQQRNPKLYKGQVWDATINLDLLTSRGPSDDWWLRPDDFQTLEGKRSPYYENIKRSEFSTHLTRAQKHIAHIASENEAMDWLQSALILSTERYPWRHAGQLLSDDMQNLLTHIERRALETDDVNPWYVLLSHHEFYGRDIPPLLLERAQTAKAKISACYADPSTYAIATTGPFNIGDTGEYRQSYPLAKAKLLTAQMSTTHRGLDFAYFANIKSLADISNSKTAFALPLMLSAPNLEEVKEAHKLSQTVTRPLLLLPAHDLAQISPATAFTHHYSLGEIPQASKLLSHWLDKSPDNTEPFADIFAAQFKDKITQSLVILRMKCLSHFVSTFCRENTNTHIHRNLGAHRADGVFIKRELAEWLYPSFEAYNFHQEYYRQYDKKQNRRYGAYWYERREFERLRDRPSKEQDYIGRKNVMERGPVPEIFASETFPISQGLAALADTEKITVLAGDKNLIRILTLNVIEWVSQAEPGSRRKNKDLMAEALYRVIRENKHQTGGEIDGFPVQKKAHQLLQLHFKDTKWAKKTPYWWPSRHPHG